MLKYLYLKVVLVGNRMSSQIPPIDKNAPNNIKTATFAMGCFWGPDARFGCMPGVVRTRVGYAGGSTENPTYQNISDYIETIQIDYDPEVISFADLLDVFWNNHNPSEQAYRRQYTSALFFHNEKQKELIGKSKQQAQSKLSGTVLTEITPFEKFYYAEDYHQKYRLRQMPELINAFMEIYPISKDLINSTAAARVNGYLGGYGSVEQLQKEVNQFGLSEIAINILTDLTK